MVVNAIPLFSRKRGAKLGLQVLVGLAVFLLANPAPAGVWRFAVIGDTRGDNTNTPSAPWVNTDVLAAQATAITNDQAELVLVTGDLIYGVASSNDTNLATQYAVWTNALAPVYAAGIPVYPVRGNHETYGDDTTGTAYLAAFSNSLPVNGPTDELGLTYSFTHKNAFFAALDQYRNAHQVNQDWLTNQLALNTKPHVFTFGHEPAVQMYHSDILAQNPAARDAFLNSLHAAGSRLYFCGHDHFYNHAIVSTTNGGTIRQVVVGSGGAPFYDWDGAYGADFGETNMAVKVRHIGFTNGYCLVTVSNLVVTLEWKGSANLTTWQTFDTYQYSLTNRSMQRVNDYDGDSKADPAIYEEAAGNWTVLFSSLNYTSGLQPVLGSTGWRPAPGDYDGDGKTDPAVMSKTGTWWIMLSGSAHTIAATNLSVTNAGPVCADYDGDGLTDPAYYRKASRTWGVLLSDSSYQAVTVTWGASNFIPLVADFDGDGKADPSLYDESSGEWRTLLSGSGYLDVSATFGGPGYEAVPADFDNDARTDLCIYNKTNGLWQALLSASGYAAASGAWGSAAYKPVPGDYDGDGRADPMVHAATLTNWMVMLSGSGYQGAEMFFGGTNDAAVKPLWREDLVFLAFGDSITYGGGSSNDGPATGYPKLLEDKLKQYFDGYFLSINRGNPGEDTYDGFERFVETLDTTDPDLILLMEGTNDHFYGNPFDEIEENLRNMVSTALARGIPVIIATIPPVISNNYRDRSEQAARIAAFNPRIYSIASDFNIRVAPVYEAITAVPGWESSLMDQPSANHPNDAGYAVVRDAFYAPVTTGLNSGEY
ncbi:MAG: metallophosphoesterase [Lentisphaerae bacterium]|nr:metallophosphoesterase [Lentisphaerota bacterium]